MDGRDNVIHDFLCNQCHVNSKVVNSSIQQYHLLLLPSIKVRGMEFKFNFPSPHGEEQFLKEEKFCLTNSNLSENDYLDKQTTPDEVAENPIVEIFITDDHQKLINTITPLRMTIGKIEFLTLSTEDVQKNCTSCEAIVESVKSHSDLIAGKYEGGLKIWEGSIDLCTYLQSVEIDFNCKKVLELGCGAGIPGIFAVQKGGHVHFQDFNDEVLNFMTAPNTILNNSNSLENLENCQFFGGDWLSLLSLLKTRCRNEQDKYDVILTAETIYNPQHQIHLYNVMKTCLKQDGVIFVAAKCYYFGLGGGIKQFEELIQFDGYFDCITCWNTDQGLKRVILKLTRKTS